jgi:hypothetical protein
MMMIQAERLLTESLRTILHSFIPSFRCTANSGRPVPWHQSQVSAVGIRKLTPSLWKGHAFFSALIDDTVVRAVDLADAWAAQRKKSSLSANINIDTIILSCVFIGM